MANEGVATLHSQLTTQRYPDSTPDDFHARESEYQSEISRARQECKELRDALHSSNSKAVALARENERMQVEADILRKSLTFCRTAFKQLTGFLLEVIEPQAVTTPDKLDTVKRTVIQRLEEVGETTKTDLDGEIQRVTFWRARDPQARCSVVTEASTMKQIPFNDIGSEEGGKGGEGGERGEGMQEEEDSRVEEGDVGPGDSDPGELEVIKRNIMIRIAGMKKPGERDTAVALFDFEASEVSPIQPGDLSFPRGALITILKRDSQGWWLGETDGRVGIFPYNYVNALE